MKHLEKVYLTKSEMIRDLKQDNLIIGNNNKYAVKCLNEIGYYKLINGYKHPFKLTNEQDNSKYLDGTSLNQLVKLYKFDFELKHTLFKYICILENIFKVQIAEVISKNYGHKDCLYLKPENFRPDSTNTKCRTNFNKLKKHFYKEIAKHLEKKKASIVHYKNDIGYYPFWVAVNVLSFGDIGLFYKKMKPHDQKEIADYFNIMPNYLESFLDILVLFRNACAHNEVVFRLHTEKRIKTQAYKEIYDHYNIEEISTNKYKYGTNDIFAVILILKLMLPAKIFFKFKEELLRLLSMLDVINSKPKQWVLIAMGINLNLNYIFDKIF